MANADSNIHTRRCHYFVDEAGDLTLFSGKGKVLIGTPGCSRYFILGVLEVAEPERLSQDLLELRTTLLSDPYFADVPSMQVGNGKTAVEFHATKDLPEVRREVFRVLLNHDLRFSAEIKDKNHVLNYVRERNEIEPSYKYRPTQLYDSLTKRMITEIYQERDYQITFARLGHSDRSDALCNARIEGVKDFEKRYGFSASIVTDIRQRTSEESS